MPKPLRSDDPRPRDIQFTHFGVLNAGAQSKTSLFTSITINVLLGLICLIIGAATKKVVDNRDKKIEYIAVKEKPPEPPKPPPPPPPKIPPPPKLPDPPKIEPPKIKLPDVKIPDPPKPVAVVQPKPVPVIVPAQPKMIVAAAAPKPVNVNLAQSASIPNHDPHPSAVKLGATDNPLKSLTGPAVSNVNLGSRGVPGMPAGNTGNGPASTKVSLGSGQPTGSIGGKGAVAVVGVPHGIPGGTGATPGNGTGIQAVQIARAAPPPAMPTTHALAAPASHPPQVLYKPRPSYTAEATSLHIEGTVTVKIHVASSGAVTVVGVVAGLGHGLDQSAVSAAQSIRFKPATDAAGNAVDWEGPVNIIFQIAS